MVTNGSVARMPAARRPDPPPFRSNEFAPVIIATAIWAIAFVVLLTQHQQMAARGQGWWLWVTLTGFALGLWGLFMLHLQQRHARRSQPGVQAGPETRTETPDGSQPDPGSNRPPAS
jgi:Protein of unknown function (DUF2530)